MSADHRLSLTWISRSLRKMLLPSLVESAHSYERASYCIDGSLRSCVSNIQYIGEDDGPYFLMLIIKGVVPGDAHFGIFCRSLVESKRSLDFSSLLVILRPVRNNARDLVKDCFFFESSKARLAVPTSIGLCKKARE